jgi:hypothetical protein
VRCHFEYIGTVTKIAPGFPLLLLLLLS